MSGGIPSRALELAAVYLRTGDAAAWDAYESWHLCAATRMGPGRWAGAVVDAVRHAPDASTPGFSRRAAHVTDTLLSWLCCFGYLKQDVHM